jgi:hypothetical protein
MLVNGLLLESSGNTPLIRLPRLSALTGYDILGKAEHMNPGGSVKDAQRCRSCSKPSVTGRDPIKGHFQSRMGVGLR